MKPCLSIFRALPGLTVLLSLFLVPGCRSDVGYHTSESLEARFDPNQGAKPTAGEVLRWQDGYLVEPTGPLAGGYATGPNFTRSGQPTAASWSWHSRVAWRGALRQEGVTQVPLPGILERGTSPVLMEGNRLLYVAGHDSNPDVKLLILVDGADGRELGRQEIPFESGANPSCSSPLVLEGGRFCMNVWSQDWQRSGIAFGKVSPEGSFSGMGYKLFARSPGEGNVVENPPGRGIGAPVFDGGSRVYVSGCEGLIYTLNPWTDLEPPLTIDDGWLQAPYSVTLPPSWAGLDLPPVLGANGLLYVGVTEFQAWRAEYEMPPYVLSMVALDQKTLGLQGCFCVQPLSYAKSTPEFWTGAAISPEGYLFAATSDGVAVRYEVGFDTDEGGASVGLHPSETLPDPYPYSSRPFGGAPLVMGDGAVLIPLRDQMGYYRVMAEPNPQGGYHLQVVNHFSFGAAYGGSSSGLLMDAKGCLILSGSALVLVEPRPGDDNWHRLLEEEPSSGPVLRSTPVLTRDGGLCVVRADEDGNGHAVLLH